MNKIHAMNRHQQVNVCSAAEAMMQVRCRLWQDIMNSRKSMLSSFLAVHVKYLSAHMFRLPNVYASFYPALIVYNKQLTLKSNMLCSTKFLPTYIVLFMGVLVKQFSRRKTHLNRRRNTVAILQENEHYPVTSSVEQCVWLSTGVSLLMLTKMTRLTTRWNILHFY